MKVTLVKSPIGYNQKQKATVKALGLRKINSSVIIRDTPMMRGMVNRVSHLVQVEEA